MCASVCMNVVQYYGYRDSVQTVTDTVTETEVVYVVRTDTVPTVVKEIVTEYVKKTDILSHEVNDVLKNGGDCDVLDDSLPVVQKTYSDSTYTAYVSGIKYRDLPRLDSIRVRERMVYETVTVTKEVQRNPKRWSVGVMGGYGYGIKSGRAEPYVGVGVSYGLWEF